MQEIDAIQNKSESKVISSINNDTTENGHIVFDYREKSGYRNFDTQDWFKYNKTKLSNNIQKLSNTTKPRFVMAPSMEIRLN